MASTLPSYDDAMKELNKITPDIMAPEVKTRAYTAMANQARLSKSSVAEEVKKLAQRALATDKAFENIRQQLLIVDSNDYKDKYGQPIAKLEPTWVRYQKRYIDLLWRSRSAATETEAYLRDLTDVIIPLILKADSKFEDNLKNLQSFMNRGNPIDSTSQADDFTALQSDVKAFTVKFDTFADDEGARLTTEIETLKTSIGNLQKELTDCNKLVTQMGIALGVTAGAVTVGIIAAVNCLGPLAPGAVISMLIAGTIAVIGELSQLIVALTRKAAIDIDIAGKQHDIDEANKQLFALGKVKSMLERCSEEADEMFGRLDSFTSIWAAAAQDAELISKSDLAKVHSDNTVEARIQLISASYSSLAAALSDYATTIDQSDLTPQDSDTTQAPA